jgi:hypothetical protein
MKTLCPSLKKIVIFSLALTVTVVVHAQNAAYTTEVNSKTIISASETQKARPLVKIRAVSDKKVVLNWAPFSEGVSHYVLERSFDGRNYQEAAVFFTGEWGNEPEYFYTDKFKQSYTGPLYYRLRVVGLDGSELYSAPSITGGNRL